MMRGGRVREMLAVIEGHKSGAKIKIFAPVHPTSQGSLLTDIIKQVTPAVK